jgi:hypothetical protein
VSWLVLHKNTILDGNFKPTSTNLAPTGKKQDVGTTPKYIDRKPCLRYQCSPWWLLITALGIAFAIWARAHLGANWSAAVSIRADHELIRTGPIYTGMILAAIGTALVIGQMRGLLAVAIFIVAF